LAQQGLEEVILHRVSAKVRANYDKFDYNKWESRGKLEGLILHRVSAQVRGKE
jgi:hypothetical protein